MTDEADNRSITVTVAALKAYEAAVRARSTLAVEKMRASDTLDAAKLSYELAVAAESDAMDAELRAAATLHGRKP